MENEKGLKNNQLPHILWFLFAIVVFFFLLEPIKSNLIPNISKLDVPGVSIEFNQIKSELSEIKPMTDEPGSKVTDIQFQGIQERIKLIAPIIKGASVLWVDDKHPTQNIRERRILKRMGIFVDMVKSTKEALSLTNLENYDAIISDMRRNNNSGEGINLLKQLKEKGLPFRTVIYAGGFDVSRGTPAYAHGMTNRTDHLLHYVMDIIVRQKTIN